MQLAHWDLTQRLIGAAIEVHRRLGPGFLEVLYQRALERELTACGLPFRPQVEVPVLYRGALIGTHVLDLLVADLVVVELKAIRALDDVHFAVVRSYLRATNLQHGLLLNFSKAVLSIRRVIT